MKTISPAPTQIFARPIESQQTTASGIIITTDKKLEPKFAEVINTGAKVKHYAATETIIYKEYATTELKLDNVEYIIVAEDDVLGKVVEVN